MSWEVPAGGTIDIEVRPVRESDGAGVAVYSMTYELYAPTAVIGTDAPLSTGTAQWEADGMYLVSPTMPAAAAVGALYLVRIIVTVTVGGRVEYILVPIRCGGPTL